MAESKIKKNENDNLDQLKLNLQKKLDEVKSKLTKIKTDLHNNIKTQHTKINKNYDSYIKKLKTESNDYIKSKGKLIKNKEILNFEYSKLIQNLKNLEKFSKNYSEIIINSIENYNDFLLDKLPYYKESANHFIINKSEKLGNNNIFSKLNQNQINKIINQINNRCIMLLINNKYTLNIDITPKNNLYEDKILTPTPQNENNKIELNNIMDEEFKLLFNKDNFNENNKKKQNEMIFQNCTFKTIDISDIPYDLNNLKIINSKLYSSIFENINYNNLISLFLDNCKLDSDNFEDILKSLLRKDNKTYNNLKIFSAKNNSISRIIKNAEIKSLTNKFTSLEIFNLANNNIYDANEEILKLFPNIKIFDLSNNRIVYEYKCKELIKKCKGLVILIRNTGIMKEPFNSTYRQYYIGKLTNEDYPLSSVNFDSLFYKKNYEDIMSVNFSKIRRSTNILELNFSSCNIDDQSMATLICKCSAINNNISKVNLSFNSLTENFLDLLINENNNINILLHELEELDLSFNPIKFIGQKNYKSDNSKNNNFIKFLNHFPQLGILLMKGTPFEEAFNNYFKKDINIFYEKEKLKNVKTKITGDSLEIKDIILNNHLKINPKFNLIINDILSDKYTKRIKVLQNDYSKNHLIIDNIN